MSPSSFLGQTCLLKKIKVLKFVYPYFSEQLNIQNTSPSFLIMRKIKLFRLIFYLDLRCKKKRNDLKIPHIFIF